MTFSWSVVLVCSVILGLSSQAAKTIAELNTNQNVLFFFHKFNTFCTK